MYALSEFHSWQRAVVVFLLGVGVELAELVGGRLLGASEAAGGLWRNRESDGGIVLTVQLVMCPIPTVGIGLALRPVGDLRPVADSAVLVEPEAGGAGVLLGVTVHAGVEDVADAGVGVGVEAVETGTQVAGALGGLWGRAKVQRPAEDKTKVVTSCSILRSLQKNFGEYIICICHSRSSSLSPQSTLK